MGVVLNPALLYANEMSLGNFTIYQDEALKVVFLQQIQNAIKLLKESDLYDPSFEMEVCLNDGSLYPILLEKARFKAFAMGFYNNRT